MTRRALLVGGSVGGVVLASLAAVTRPFTVASDAVVLLGFAGVAAIGLAERRMAPVAPVAATDQPSHRRWGPRWGLWAGALAATVGWELFCYFASPRGAHPTLSSMLDTVDGHRPGHALAFAVWLWLGWMLVRRR